MTVDPGKGYVKLLTALHLIALLCGGRVAHDGSLMASPWIRSEFPLQVVEGCYVIPLTLSLSSMKLSLSY